MPWKNEPYEVCTDNVAMYNGQPVSKLISSGYGSQNIDWSKVTYERYCETRYRQVWEAEPTSQEAADKNQFPPPQPADGALHFENNQWTGYVTPQDFERENKIIPLGPSPPGMFGQLEALLILFLITKLMQTPQGTVILKDLIVKYLDVTGDIITTLHKSSMAHPITAIMNNHTAISVYERLGLLSSNKALHERAWVDHVLGEFLKLQYVADMMQGISTLVQGATNVVGSAAVKPGEFGTALSGLSALGALPPIIP
jgi:hypothetical protein